jgi:hypothetical protein
MAETAVEVEKSRELTTCPDGSNTAERLAVS